jgi:hypothetical protein
VSLDRFGKPVRIGFAEHECLWIKAAMELPRRERLAAFNDIADMTGRSTAQIRSKAYALYNQAMRTWAAQPRGRVIVPEGPVYEPWIKPVSEAQKMAGRAR